VDETVLIADDDRDIVRFVEVNLRLEGFEVITAHDGQDALTKALDLQPNLILLDVMMPRMDGYEVCTKLRADGRSAHIPRSPTPTWTTSSPTTTATASSAATR
jgi:DNA-binding response OmpR family regulator